MRSQAGAWERGKAGASGADAFPSWGLGTRKSRGFGRRRVPKPGLGNEEKIKDYDVEIFWI